jgi:hypothetical protein
MPHATIWTSQKRAKSTTRTLICRRVCAFHPGDTRANGQSPSTNRAARSLIRQSCRAPHSLCQHGAGVEPQAPQSAAPSINRDDRQRKRARAIDLRATKASPRPIDRRKTAMPLLHRCCRARHMRCRMLTPVHIDTSWPVECAPRSCPVG